MEGKIFCFVNTMLGFKENELKPKNLYCVQGPLGGTRSSVYAATGETTKTVCLRHVNA